MGIGLLDRIIERSLFLIDQGEFHAAILEARAGKERLHLARGAASQTQDAGDAGMSFFLDHLGDSRTHHFHPCPDAFEHVEAQAVHQHLIDVRAFALPVIGLVHDFEIAGIAERLRIAAINDGAGPHLGRHHDFRERLSGLQDVAIVHHAPHQIIAGAPQGTPMLDQARFAGLIGAFQIEIALELPRQNHVLVEKIAIRAQQLQKIGAEDAIFLRHQLA